MNDIPVAVTPTELDQRRAKYSLYRMITDEQFRAGCAGVCLPLSFLLEVHPRDTNRKSMPGLRDSAIFFRLWDLCSALSNPEFQERLSPMQKDAAAEFESVMRRLPWRTIRSDPHIEELADDNLQPLLEPGRRLYNALKGVTD